MSAGGVVGVAQLSDSAVLSGGYNPAGTISFTLTAPDSTTTPEGSVTVTGDGIYNSPAVLATEVGTYTWHASYGGDANNSPAVDDGRNEGVATVKAAPAIITQATVSAGGVVGVAKLSDSATLSGGFGPTGTISFTLTAPDGTTTSEGSVTVTGDGTYPAPTAVKATEVGTYSWHATYSGDGLNAGAADSGANEGVTTVKASPTIATTASAGGVVGATALTDSATLTGGDLPGGTITFTLSAPDGTKIVETATATGAGTYTTPTSVAATQVGTYTWSASYAGDGLNNGAIDDGQNETASVTKANPNLITTATVTAGGVVGSAIPQDSAALSGGYRETGALTFTLKDPAGVVVDTETVPVSGDGTYATHNTTLAARVGTYTWSVSYGGDPLNQGTVDQGGPAEMVTTVKASPTIVTAAGASAGGVVGVALLTDAATLSGGDAPGGTITFTLTAPDGTTTSQQVTAAGDGTYTTPIPVAATQVGTYTWSAQYGGDGLNNGATDDGSNEAATTVKSTPKLVTTAAAAGVVGVALGDSATLSGGDLPGGTISFTLTAPDGTTTPEGSVTVTGDGTYTSPLPVTATEVGTYTWHASYGGDALNNGAVDQGGASEQATTLKASPAINTQATVSAGGVVGTALMSDSATLSGGFNPTGTITFTLTAPDGTTTPEGSVLVAGDGSYASPKAVTATEVGAYTWHATYSGDSDNVGAADNGANEGVATIKASPTIITAAGAGGVVGVAMLSDTAQLSGGDAPGGTITFTLTAPGNTTVSVQLVAVAGDGTYSPAPVLATLVGTYTWHATYNGDTLNNGAADQGGAAEQATTVKACPTILTTAGAGGVVGAATLTDTATLGGGDNPTGSITFTLKAPDGTVAATESATVSGDGTYTTPTPVAATQVGTYTWSASYGGDALNNGAHDNGVGETSSVAKAGPKLVTTATVSASGVVGLAIPQDSAALSGGYRETGSLTFTLKDPNGVVVDTETVPVSGDGTYATHNANIAAKVGTYTWTASYAGDGLNNSATDPGGAAEQATTTKASPTITTTAGAGGVVGVTTLSDSAKLSGGYSPSGTITFTLTAPDGTKTVETVTAAGDGTYATPAPVAATQVGTYTWSASYAGDGLNNGAVDPGGAAEQASTVKASPAIVTCPSPSSEVAGSGYLKDSATISGGYGETGTITFTLYSPSNAVVDTETVAVNGNGTYATPTGYLPTAAGTYQWVAAYGGDARNNPVAGPMGSEPVAVTPQLGSISGVKYLDLTGNGFSADDTPYKGGVTIQLYKDVAGTGVLDATKGPFTTTVTSSVDGSYAFNGLAPGTYFVQEVVPSGFVRTGPAAASYYTVNVAAGSKVTGENFDDFPVDQCAATNISYKINGCTTVTDLRGNTHQGDQVQVTFSIPAGVTDTVTLVSYTAPGATFDANTASQQAIYLASTGTFTGGTHTLTVILPNCDYQVDFVCGAAIDHFGPAGSNIFYSAEGRLFSADNGGTVACSPATISGTKYIDATGNGFSADDRTLTGSSVTVDVYRDALGSTALNTASDPLVARVQTDPTTGNYSVSGLAPGRYFVQEEVPTGFVQTGPASGGYLVVNVAAGAKSAGNNFDDYKMPTCNLTNVSYLINGKTVVSDLNGQVKQGDHIDATFTLPAGATVTLVSYIAPSASFNAATAAQQAIFDSATVTSAAGGTVTLSVDVPAGYFQVDLVCGAAIDHFGPAGSNIFYGQEGRLDSSANGGNNAYGSCALVHGDAASTSFWAGSSGQNLINNLNGSSSSTKLASWLSSEFPGLFPKALIGTTNASVAAYFKKLKGNGATQLEAQILGTALAVYVSDSDLAGGNIGASYGFNVSAGGTGAKAVNVGSNGSALGLANYSNVVIMTLLQQVDSLATNGLVNSSARSAATAIFTSINSI